MSLSNHFEEHFATIEDPRKDTHNKRHKLMDILVLTILAVISGAEDWVAVERFGESKKDWLGTFLELPYGIPSHDTLGDLFQRMNPKQLQESFLSWINALVRITGGEIIAVDGKTLRRSYDKGDGKGAIHMVSAWAVKNRVVLGQVKTEEKSNEITAIPELLEMLDIENGVVTIDAMGCQKEIASQIVSQKGDYVLALKGNQGTLHGDVELYLTTAKQNAFKEIAHSYYETFDGDHGRIETRRYWITDQIHWLEEKGKWVGLKSIGMVESEREIDNKMTRETRYYIASINPEAQRFAECVRAHWNIENNLHWSLDVSFNEDQCRVRKGHAAENFAVIRHIALNLLKQENTAKVGIANKRKMAGWNNQYLAKVLAVQQN
jgi:predicted transposase YbfD/YdcC